MSLVFETVVTEGLAHLSYLIGDSDAGVAAVIDPRRDVDVYVDLALKQKVAITHALETHIHADFISGARELAARTGTAKVYASVEGGAKYGFEHEPLHDGDTIKLGSVILKVLFTPGHTPEHVCYLASERAHANSPWGLFSGDTLFASSVGRPDLLGKEQSEKLARQLFASLREKIMTLDDGVVVFPAHGSGSPCGANIGDRPVTTIGYERRFNPSLQTDSEEDFVDFVLLSQPPEPRYYRRMKKENAAGPEVLEGLPVVPPLAPRKFKEAVEAGQARLVDTRSMLAFGGGHIAGALNIGLREEMATWAGWMLDAAQPILLVLERDEQLPQIVTELIRTGYTCFAGYLLGGMTAWNNRGLPLVELEELQVRELRKRIDVGNLQLLDVRAPHEWGEGHIPTARHIFVPDIPAHLDDLDRDKPLAVYCGSGYRSSIAASLLQAEGFKQVINIPGSMSGWKAARYEVE